MKGYCVKVNPSGVVHIMLGDNIFCLIHHVHAGGVTQALARAEVIRNALEGLD